MSQKGLFKQTRDREEGGVVLSPPAGLARTAQEGRLSNHELRIGHVVIEDLHGHGERILKRGAVAWCGNLEVLAVSPEFDYAVDGVGIVCPRQQHHFRNGGARTETELDHRVGDSPGVGRRRTYRFFRLLVPPLQAFPDVLPDCYRVWAVCSYIGKQKGGRQEESTDVFCRTDKRFTTMLAILCALYVSNR